MKGYLTVTAVTGYMGYPMIGTAVINADDTITWTPPSGYSGTAPLSYTISDGHGGTAQGVLDVTVTT